MILAVALIVAFAVGPLMQVGSPWAVYAFGVACVLALCSLEK